MCYYIFGIEYLEDKYYGNFMKCLIIYLLQIVVYLDSE